MVSKPGWVNVKIFMLNNYRNILTLKIEKYLGERKN